MAASNRAHQTDVRPATGRATFDVDIEWDTLTTALNRWGILHIAPQRVRRAGLPATPRDICLRLWSTGTSRLHQATVFLLLTHPDTADAARAAIERLSGNERERAMRRYVAAAAMQRMARTRITQHLGLQPMIPAAYHEEFCVPSLDEEFGRCALLAVAEQEASRYGYDAWGTYLNLLDLFLGAIRGRHWGKDAVAHGPGAP